MSNSNLFFSKKAMSKPTNFMVSALLGFLVIFLLFNFFSDTVDTTESGLSDFKLKSIIEKCEISSANCNVMVCSEEFENECNEVETSTWNSFKVYSEKCSRSGKYSEISDENYKKLGCGVLYKKIEDALNGIESSSDSRNSDGTKKYVELTDEQKLAKVEKFKSSSFYSSNKNQFETYADSKSFEKAIRFECHKFNAENSGFDDVPCTLKDGESFSRVYKETNYAAFLKAYNDNSLVAFKSSSYGFAQMLGENIVRFEGSENADELLEKVKINSNQIKYFFKFLEENGIISDMQNDNYQQIAKKYNGPKYAQNNYDNDLKTYHESLV
jgi:hypothetical protein